MEKIKISDVNLKNILQELSGFSSIKVQIVLVLVVIATFINTLPNQFVYDDHVLILENHHIGSWDYFNTIFTKSFDYDADKDFSRSPIQYYRPFGRLLLGLGYQAFGPHPYYWHWLNIALFSIMVILVYQVFLKLSQDQGITTLGALFFAVHPLHSQGVAWANGLIESLLGIFFLGTFLIYLRLNEQRDTDNRYILMIGALIFCLSSLFSKESAFILPVLIAAHQFLVKKTPWLKRSFSILIELIPCFIAVVSYFLVRQFVYGNKVVFTSALPYKITILTIPRVIVEYMIMFFWPIGLSLLHPMELVESLISVRFLLPMSLLMVITVLVYLSRSRLLQIACLWVIITLIPVLNLGLFASQAVQVKIIQDRFLFIPSIGLALIVGMGLVNLYRYIKTHYSELEASKLHGGLTCLIALSLLGLVYLTIQQNSYWQSDTALWQRTIQINPDSEFARCRYGEILLFQRMEDEATNEYLKVLEIKQGECFCALAMLGNIYATKDPYKALSFYQKAIILAEKGKISSSEFQDSVNILMKMAELYFQMGNKDGAEKVLEKTIAMYPSYKPAQYVLAELKKGASIITIDPSLFKN